MTAPRTEAPTVEEQIEQLEYDADCLKRDLARQRDYWRNAVTDLVRVWRRIADAFEDPANDLRNGVELAQSRRKAATELERLLDRAPRTEA